MNRPVILGAPKASCSVWATGNGTVFLELEKGRQKCGLETGLDAAREIARMLLDVASAPFAVEQHFSSGTQGIAIRKYPSGQLELIIKRRSQLFRGWMIPGMAQQMAGAIRDAAMLEQLSLISRKGEVEGAL